MQLPAPVTSVIVPACLIVIGFSRGIRAIRVSETEQRQHTTGDRRTFSADCPLVSAASHLIIAENEYQSSTACDGGHELADFGCRKGMMLPDGVFGRDTRSGARGGRAGGRPLRAV